MEQEDISFLTDLQRQEASPRTLASYESDLRCFARWFAVANGEAFSAAAVAPTDVRDYKAHLVTVERRSPATVNRRLAALRRFFQWAKASKIIDELPTQSVKGLASVPAAPKALEKREVDRLIRAAEKDGSKRDLAIVLTLRHTGLRVGELCALRLDDIKISERKGSLVVRSGKGSKYRSIPLNVDARRAIGDYLAVRPKVSDDHFFIGQRGDGLKPQAVENLVGKYARLARLEGVTPHTLRHTFGKQALDAGENLVTVATLMGHERLETTAIYTKPSERDLERAVDKLATS
ncbi:MAG: tyrosine-type recombinase/integrase [Dehalococcoidales bacterium]|nr:tyrosine-type recombinase/integrase [Dehalococcoidales bacterium]